MSYIPKTRGRGRSNYRGNNNFSRYTEHDDRNGPPQRDYERGTFRGKVTYQRGNTRRGGGHNRGSRGRNNNYRSNFRNSRGRRPYGPRGQHHSSGDREGRDNASPFYEDDDGDVKMEGDAETDVRFKPYARPRGKYKARSNRQEPRTRSWHQITIVNGSSLDEEWLHQEIQSVDGIQYNPVQYHLDGKNSCFFIEDSSTANDIKRCSRKFSSPEGVKVLILTRTTDIVPFGDNEVEKIQSTLSERFKVDSQHIDLSKFYHEANLRDHRIKLERPYHAYIVAKIIVQNIPSLQSIDLSSNNLNSCESFKLLVAHLPSVKKLNLAKNRFQSFKDLIDLKPWDLSELTLDQNPLCGKYKSQTEYISDARDYFPNLLILDGHNLPAPVKFDVDSGKLPASIKDFLSPTGQDIINQFIQNFFTCYDQSRMGLMEAYNEAALLSVTIPSSPRGPSLSNYIPHNRNLKKIKTASIKTSSLSSNRSELLHKLNQLPATKHLMTSLSIDVPLVTSSIVNFIVRGFFEETIGSRCLRAFSRSFFCQVVQENLKIINEQYFIRNPTAAETKESKSLPKVAPTPAAQAPPNLQSEMITAFSKESGMNARYSEQCLIENNWDYAKAGQVFLQLKGDGKIPPAAFVK